MLGMELDMRMMYFSVCEARINKGGVDLLDGERRDEVVVEQM